MKEPLSAMSEKERGELFKTHLKEIADAHRTDTLSFDALLTLMSIVAEDVLGRNSMPFARDPMEWLEGSEDRMMGAVAALYIMAHKEFDIMPQKLSGSWRKAIMHVMAPAMERANRKNGRRLH